MYCDLYRQLQLLWSPAPPSGRWNDVRTSIETLLEPIRYSMAFLTLFSILSSIIIAILLLPLEPLQLLAQFISLIVSLSGLFGTFRRSIMLSSIYALSMLLFLFLQCSYFFVLLKLVQEVNIGNSSSSNNNNNKLWYGDVMQPLNVASEFTVFHDSYQRRAPEVDRLWTEDTKFPTSAGSQQQLPSQLSPVVYYQSEPYSRHYRPVSPTTTATIGLTAHVRHVSVMLNEELSYLSLLTVPMIAWLPPSLFMETIAVLLLSMQALAAACFLYALHRSQAYLKVEADFSLLA